MKENEMNANQKHAISELKKAMRQAIQGNYMTEQQAREFFLSQMRDIGVTDVTLD